MSDLRSSRSGGIRRSARTARAAAERRFERAQQQRGIRDALASFQSEQRFGAALLSGGIAYRFFLWLLPFGLLVAGIASFWVRIGETSLEHTAKSFGLAGVAAHSAAAAVEDGSRARWYLLGAGLVLITWAGIGAVRALRVASRLAWGIEPERLQHPLSSSAIFTALTVVGVAASMTASWARHDLGAAGLVVTLATVLVYFLMALFAFSHLPRPPGTSWLALWPGALLVGAGVTGLHVFLAYYLAARLEHLPALYGTLGGASVVLLVLFLLARFLVSAMFLNATLQRAREGEDQTWRS